jgi:3-(3-hydroxy-phenyl)propionate hydroxylase
VWQWCQRAQGQHLASADRRLEALDESLLPRRAPLGWVVIVRPDRCVMAEGPVEQVQELLDQALRRLAPDAEHLPRRSANLGPLNAIDAT